MSGCLAVVMRQKALLMFLSCVLLTTIFIFTLPTRRHRTLKTIVKETQEKINNIRSNLISEGLDTVSLQPDIRYLQQLGLSSTHSSGEVEDDQLLVVSAVHPGSTDLVAGFIRSVATHLPDATINLYDLGVSRSDKKVLYELCNSSLCSVTEFQFSLWPNHVKDLKLQAYRPIGVQLALRERNLVLWMNLDCRLTTSDLSQWLNKVKESGVVAWPQDPLTKDSSLSDLQAATPTTALTHPRMFEYFPNQQKEDYEFQHMVSGRCLLFSHAPTFSSQTSTSLSSSLILPWLKCVLIEDCINPIGAQSTGCRFDKKPQYRYSGCHSYDVSALNIVLGEKFEFRESLYLSKTSLVRQVNQESKGPSTAYLNISEYGLD